MSDKSKIEWTDATWTPIRARNRKTGKVGWHCEHKTPGCVHCYSEGINLRLGTGLPFKPGHLQDIELFLDEEMLLAPLRWKQPKMVFVCSMTDLFADFVPDAWIDRIFAVMALAPQHTFQVLTKRADRMRQYISWPAFDRIVLAMMRFTDAGFPTRRDTCAALNVPYRKPDSAKDWWPLRNVWLGVSTEDQERANERIPLLLDTTAAVRFVSAEPLLAPLDLTSIDTGEADGSRIIDALTGLARCGDDIVTGLFDQPDRHLDWVIVGGESTVKARPMHPDWARSLRDQCAEADIAFFFKQWGEWAPVPGLERTPPKSGYSNGAHRFRRVDFDGVAMVAFGKKGSGRKLDGMTHDAMPTGYVPPSEQPLQQNNGVLFDSDAPQPGASS